MKAVVLFVFAALIASAAVSVRAAEAEAEADADMAVDSELDLEFNTHDADALEVDLNDSNEMELETETTTEAELVDSEEELAEAEEESDAEFEAEDEGEAEAEAEQEAEGEAEAKAESGLASVTEAELNVEAENFAAVQVKGCTPAVNSALKCPAGGAVFGKISRGLPPNGCGPDGAKILNDKLLGGTFTPCCNGHDTCYGAKSDGKPAKDLCDTQFYDCLKRTCGSGVLCKSKAWIYYQAVSLKGCDAWNTAKIKNGC